MAQKGGGWEGTCWWCGQPLRRSRAPRQLPAWHPQCRAEQQRLEQAPAGLYQAHHLAVLLDCSVESVHRLIALARRKLQLAFQGAELCRRCQGRGRLGRGYLQRCPACHGEGTRQAVNNL